MKNKKNILIFVGLILFFFAMLWNGILEEIIPHSRQIFLNYNSFNKRTERVTFPNVLPESSYHFKYYVYEGWLRDACGYHVAFTLEDYASVKKACSERYCGKMENGKVYCYDGREKQNISLEEMTEKGIDFLDKLTVDENIQNYYVLCCYQNDNAENYEYSGVLCNDETYEMIEFSFYGPSKEDNCDKEKSYTLQDYFEILIVVLGVLFYMFWIIVIPVWNRLVNIKKTDK